jgi:hypothetical protein
MAVKRKSARQLTTDEVMARIFGRTAAKQLREIVGVRKPLKRKKKRAARGEE